MEREPEALGEGSEGGAMRETGRGRAGERVRLLGRGRESDYYRHTHVSYDDRHRVCATVKTRHRYHNDVNSALHSLLQVGERDRNKEAARGSVGAY